MTVTIKTKSVCIMIRVSCGRFDTSPTDSVLVPAAQNLFVVSSFCRSIRIVCSAS